MDDGDKIIDFRERKVASELKPLAGVLYRLVQACKRLIWQRPSDIELEEIRRLVRAYDKEIRKDDAQ